MANDANPAIGTPKLFPGLQDGAKPDTGKGPSLPKVDANALSADSKNVFTELFGSETTQKNNGMMNAVVKQTETKSMSYFEKPKTEELSIKKFIAHKATPGATLLKASFLLFALTAFAFATQNSSRFSIFGINPALQVETKSAQVTQLTSEVRVQEYLTSVLLLDQFSGLADEYLYNRAQATSVYTSTNKQEEYADVADALLPELQALLTQVQGYMKEAIPAEEIPYSIAVADEMITQLQAQADGSENQTLLQAVQDLQTTKALLQDSSFYSTLSGLSPQELSDEDIQRVFDQFSVLNASLTAMINVIQSDRTDWSVYLDVLEDLTKEVDPLFNTEFTGNLTLSNVVFNSDKTVTVTGNTTTSDSKNFTLVSDLIDTYEESDYFSDVSERNYQKGGDEDEQVYTGSFRITMTLQTNTSSNE